jgi:hypothetical protein
MLTATAPTPRTLRSPDERHIRFHIDRAVGRALVDHSFAERLLAEPSLAVETAVCAQAQFLAVREIRAHELDDFARQIFAVFWGPAQRDPDVPVDDD